jgi:hypothetical protein
MSGLFKPKIPAPPAPVPTPVVNQEIVNRTAQDVLRRRKGARATVTGAGELGSTAGSVATKDLLGM